MNATNKNSLSKSDGKTQKKYSANGDDDDDEENLKIKVETPTNSADIDKNKQNNNTENSKTDNTHHPIISQQDLPHTTLEIRVDKMVNNSKILRENSFVEPLVKNPFVHKLNLSCRDRAQLVLGGVILLPIRVASILALVSLTYVVGFLMTVGLSEQDLLEKPLTGWRKNLRGALRFLGRACIFCFGFHHIKKIGTRATKAEACLFVCGPHSSFFDAIVVLVLDLPVGVSRSENGKLPFLGRIVRAAQPILVTREIRANKMNTINEIKKRAAPDSEWPQVVIFPEGTTTNGSCLITFKPGAFIPGLSVQPVVLQYKNKINTLTWTWQGLNAYKSAFLTLCQFNNKMIITYLPVVKPNEEDKADPIEYAFKVRRLMADYLNLPTTSHTFEDCRLMIKARELKLPFESGIIEFDKIREKLGGISYDDIQKLLKTFTEYARKKDGKMTLDEFSKYIGLPVSNQQVQTIFDIYDRNKDGSIDFREFVIGLSLLSQNNSEETLKLAFKLFDKNGDGGITIENLHTMLNTYFPLNEEDVKVFFQKIDTKKDGIITYDEFVTFAKKKPEYPKILAMLEIPELKILKSNLEITRLSLSDGTRNTRAMPISMNSSTRLATKNINLNREKENELNAAESSTSLTKRSKSSNDALSNSTEEISLSSHKVIHVSEARKEDAIDEDVLNKSAGKRNESKND